MAKLEKLAGERGMTVAEMIALGLNECGSIHLLSAHLGIYPNTIRRWLRTRNYRLVVERIIRLEKTTDAA